MIPSQPVNAFVRSSAIIQNQLINPFDRAIEVAPASFDSKPTAIPMIDSKEPFVLPFKGNIKAEGTSIPMLTSATGPPGSSGVSFPAVYHKGIMGIAIKPNIADSYNIKNYGKYEIKIFDPNTKNFLTSTVVDLVPENEICMPKKFIIRDSVNKILNGVSILVSFNNRVVFTGTTDSTGTIIIPSTLQRNCYDVEINPHNVQYQSSKFRMISFENRRIESSTHFVCRQMQDDQLEIVLKWGSNAKDLDSHLFVSDGRHIFYKRKSDTNASLDCDVTSGNGPETIKVKLEPKLKYVYAVHRYSKEEQLTKSGAIVTFNSGGVSNTLPHRIVQIPVINRPEANFWVVCQIDGSTKNIKFFEDKFENHNNYESNKLGEEYFYS
ncbi:unnamed protein product [Adineta steineri]|uniref:Uncharacterized protein n=1 Tax=Adineta steineri TaxID=433720 RepID=A0A815UPQ1_9BILA|nr:unnamed protein product [Adineta steineri]CAF4157409.1 unnamed protein product [Adineta steineri]